MLDPPLGRLPDFLVEIALQINVSGRLNRFVRQWSPGIMVGVRVKKMFLIFYMHGKTYQL